MSEEKRLRIKDIYFGHIDAKHELYNATPETIARFREAFLVPDNVNETQFLGGEKYIIHGLKGTGKTALLRYLSLIAEGSRVLTKFVLFRQELDEGERSELSHAADAFEVATDGQDPKGRDFVALWRWFLHRIVVESLELATQIGVITRDDNYERYKAAARITGSPDQRRSGLLQFIPRVKRGMVAVNTDLGVVSGGASLDLEWADVNKTRATLRSILSESDRAFANLRGNEGKLYIMVDELELFTGQIKSYERNICLVRDLLKASYYFNQECRNRELPIYIIIAIRSEVLKSVLVSGHEINKIVEDFGTRITWHRPGSEPTHPLLQILARRINWSERSVGVSQTPMDALWEKYFPSHVQRVPIREYVLHQTWYRPRDVVRIFNAIRDLAGDATKFEHAHFDQIRRVYSELSWGEAIEELRVKYSVDALNAIKTLLTGFRARFTVSDFVGRMGQLREMHGQVDKLFQEKKPIEIISDLYGVGILGNLYRDSEQTIQRWSFRGDIEPLLDRQFTVQRALWATLSLINFPPTPPPPPPAPGPRPPAPPG